MSWLPELDAEAVADDLLEQLAAPALVVLALGALDDRLVVDVRELHPDGGVAVLAIEVDLGDVPRPGADLGQHDRGLVAGQRRDDRAVVERGQPRAP